MVLVVFFNCLERIGSSVRLWFEIFGSLMYKVFFFGDGDNSNNLQPQMQ